MKNEKQYFRIFIIFSLVLTSLISFSAALKPSQYDSVSDTSTTYYPTTFQTIIGTPTSTNVTYVSYDYDDLIINISETTGSPALDIRVNFTGVSSFNDVLLRAQYIESSSMHEVIFQIYNYLTSSWDTHYELGNSEEMLGTFPIFVSDAVNHLENGTVQVRFYHEDNGNINDKISIDSVQLLKGTTAITTNNHDSMSNRNSPTNHPWAYPYTNPYSFYNSTTLDLSSYVPYSGATSNVDLGSYNLTTTGIGTFGELISSVDSGQIGMGVSSPDSSYKVHFYDNINSDRTRLALFEGYTTSITAGIVSPMTFKMTTSGDMADNFGPGFLYAIQDNAGVENFVARTSGIRDGADNTGAFLVTLFNAGIQDNVLKLTNTGSGVGTPFYVGSIGAPSRGTLEVKQKSNTNTGGIGMIDSGITTSMRLYFDSSQVLHLDSGLTGAGVLKINDGGGNLILDGGDFTTTGTGTFGSDYQAILNWEDGVDVAAGHFEGNSYEVLLGSENYAIEVWSGASSFNEPGGRYAILGDAFGAAGLFDDGTYYSEFSNGFEAAYLEDGDNYVSLADGTYAVNAVGDSSLDGALALGSNTINGLSSGDINASTIYYDTLTAKSPIITCSDDWCSVDFPKLQKRLYIQKDNEWNILDIVYEGTHYTKLTFWDLVQGTQYEEIALKLNEKVERLNAKKVCENAGNLWDGICYNYQINEVTRAEAIKSEQKEKTTTEEYDCIKLDKDLFEIQTTCEREINTGDYETIYSFNNDCYYEDGFKCKVKVEI